MRSGDKRQRYAFYLILPNEISLNAAYNFKSLANSQTTMFCSSKNTRVFPVIKSGLVSVERRNKMS